MYAVLLGGRGGALRGEVVGDDFVWRVAEVVGRIGVVEVRDVLVRVWLADSRVACIVIGVVAVMGFA